MSRDWFNITLAFKDNEPKKGRGKIKCNDAVKEMHLCLLKMKTYQKDRRVAPKRMPWL